MFPGSLGLSLSGKALDAGLWSYNAVNIRDFAGDKHQTVDDTPYGGGAGMVMRADVIEQALLSLQLENISPEKKKLIYLSPRGKQLSQKMVQEFTSMESITLLCGRYEGVDQRVLDAYEIEEVSIGDYVLSGGEPAALIVISGC